MTGQQGNPQTPGTTTAVWYGGSMVEVTILDRYELQVVVKAVEGAPFVGGDVYPIRTPYTIIPIDQVYEINPATKIGF